MRFRNPSANAVAGLVSFAAGWWFLYQAYDRAGRPQPWPLKIITWW